MYFTLLFFVPMLISNIDTDDYIQNILKNTENPYFVYLNELLSNPTLQTLEKLLSSYTMSEIVESLKHLIKYKFYALSDDYKKNIICCIDMLIKYNENIDTLIVNCLRLGLVTEMVQLCKKHPEYFEVYKNSLYFIVFHSQETKLLKSIGVSFRDFYSRKIRNIVEKYELATLKNQKYEYTLEKDTVKKLLSDEDYESLKIPTPVNYISSSISLELELNLLFITNVANNYDFYLNILFDKYITNKDIAFNVVRFLLYIPFSNGVFKLAEKIREKYRSVYVAVIYDLLFYNGKENISNITIKYIEAHKEIEYLSNYFSGFNAGLKIIFNNNSVADISRKIYNMNFIKYFNVIRDMKSTKLPFINKNIYSAIIKASFEWDNYMQVYLWKILLYQKIIFDLNVDISFDLVTYESMEGFELIKCYSK